MRFPFVPIHADIHLFRIKYVPDSSKLPPPIKQTASTLKHHSNKTNSLSFLKRSNNATLLNDTTRSMPTSPSISAARIPLTQKSTPTSVPGLPNGVVSRPQALRYSLVHLLAARPASKNLLVRHLKCQEEDVEEVLHKIGKPFRLDQSKWDLTDKAFKELDVWDFNYPNQEDRQLAINRAVSAFDRMRLSTQEKLWDKLIPKEERGKGKILSHLNLHKGPIQPATTPKIEIQPTSNDNKKEDLVHGNEDEQKDLLAPNAEPMARSRSHGPIKKTKISEKEAQSKRLLSKGPKKVAPASKEKETHPAVKKGGPSSAKKVNAPKSSEFVNESDEEDGLEDANTLHTQSLPSKKTEKSSKTPKEHSSAQPTANKTTSKGPKHAVSSQPVASATTIMKNSSKPATPNHATATPKTRPTVTNTANGKDVLDQASENAGKKPTIPVKVQEKKPNSPTPASASTPAPKHRMSDSSSGSTTMKKTLSRQRTTSSPHKPSPLGSSPPTNASDFDNPEQSSTSTTPLISQMSKVNAAPNGVSPRVKGHVRNASSHSLKRKACDLDSDIHNHAVPMTNGNLNGYTNGKVTSGKRHKASDITPPTTDSDDEPLARALQKAQSFKKYYANYEKQYREVSQLENPPQEKLDELMRMHTRLAELKEQIRKGLLE